MEEEQLTPIIEELTQVLEGKASREDIEKQVKTFANVYNIEDPQRIRDSILRKYTPQNDTSFVTADHVQKSIGDLQGNENRVDVVAKVLYAEKKTVTIKGALRHIISGNLGDETGTAQFTIWDGENCELEQGAVYRFRNAYTKSWNNRVQINIGNNGSIAREETSMDVPGAAAPGQMAPGMKMKVADLKGTEGNVDLEVQVISAELKSVNVRGEQKDIVSGVLGDETGTAEFTVWSSDFDIQAGNTYAFRSAYSKLRNDQVQVNVGNRGKVEPIDKEIITSSAPVIQSTPAQQAPGERKKISELTGSESNVDIIAKVVFAERRTVTIRGENREIISGILGDDTGTASFTAWDGNTVDMEKGNVYLVSNAYTKLWNDKIQINLGNRCSVTPQDVEITPPERQISYSSSVAKVCDLKEGIGSVTVSGKVLSVEMRMINSRGEEKPVWSGLFADETGKIQFSAWNDFGLNEGDAIRIENAYIRGWKGIPQLIIGDRSAVDKIDDTFGDISAAASSSKTVGEIVATGGGLDMKITGTV
ncbi:MAG: hypothetical protein J6W72_04805, partial [Candidatus Methanomethylophilaceae archaeon]|nr:hypothetical protein [Candidatus Methanomethylophilaceae archaeon]